LEEQPTQAEPPAQEPVEGAFAAEPSTEQATTRRETRCIPLGRLDLTDKERRKIDRYLDVTKSALLFGGRVLLVEGIAEALLFPVIAQQHVLKGDQQALRMFRSAVFVPIDGTDFLPYAKILLTAFNGTRIADRLVVVTDGDKTVVEAGKPWPGETRKAALEALAAKAGADDVLDVFVNTYSLEPDLVSAGNAELLKSVYLELHPKSEENWETAVRKSGDEQASAIQKLFETTLRTRSRR